MTREDKLYAMNGATLIMLADRLGVKLACNRTHTQLKESKDSAIKKILEAETQTKTEEKPAEVENWEDNSYEEKQKKAAESDKIAENAVNKKKAVFSKDITGKTYYHGFQDTQSEKKSTGRNAKLEFEGRSQNICAWAKELGISANTLYGRIYKMGWSIEKAFTTPSRQIKK